MRDLTPYICLFDGCDQPNQMFDSRSSWLTHMGDRHRRTWQCVATEHDPVTFNDQSMFLRHMENTHTGDFPPDKLQFIADCSAHIALPILSNCPFCSKLGIDEDVEEHVVRHLYKLSLQSLPEPIDEVQQSNDESTYQGDIRKSSAAQDSRQVAVAEASTNPNAQGSKISSTDSEDPSSILETAKTQRQKDQLQAGPTRGPSSIKPKQPVSTRASSVSATGSSVSTTRSSVSTKTSSVSTKWSSKHQGSRKSNPSQPQAEVVTLWTCVGVLRRIYISYC